MPSSGGGSGFHIQPGDLHDSGSKLSEFGQQLVSGGEKLQQAGQELVSSASKDQTGVGAVIVKALGRGTEIAGKVFSEGGRVADGAGDRLHFAAKSHEENEAAVGKSFKGIMDGEHEPTVRKPGTGGTSRGGAEHGERGGSGGRSVDKELSESRPKSLSEDNHNPSEHGNSNENSTATDDPIDLATGRVFLDQTDVELDGTLPLVLTRSHRSNLRSGRWFGPSWSSTLDQRIEIEDDAVHFLAADGMLLRYPLPGAAPVLPAEGLAWPLARTQDGGYTITERGTGRTLHFAATGGATLPITAITDRNANRIEFGYGPDGVLTEVRRPGGTRIEVDSRNGRITELRFEGATLMRYDYDDTGLLRAVTNPSGQAGIFEYDQAGRLTRWVDRNGMWYSYAYGAEGRCVQARGRDGRLDCDIEYDRPNLTTRRADSHGQVTVYRLNERLQIIEQTGPTGAIDRLEWDAHHRLLAHTDPLGRVTRYEYDEDGNRTRVVQADGTAELAEYNAFGLPVVRVEPDGATWRYEYDERGNETAVVDPAGARIVRAYGDHGEPLSVTNPDGGTLRFETDAEGLPVAITDQLGNITRYQRDAFGRITTIIDHSGRTTRFEWTVGGEPLSRTLPDGAVERWVYDAEGNEVVFTDAAGREQRTEIGHFDLPVAQVRPDGTRVEFGYDSEMRLVAVTDPNGLVWRLEYDAAGNLVRETDLNGRTVSYAYDPAGQLVERVNGAGQSVGYRYDPVGNVVEKRVGDTIVVFERDAAGRVVRATNGDSVLDIEYDAAGRVVAETCNGRTLRSAFDVLGRRIARRTPSGVESSWAYDAAGQPVELRTVGERIRFGYDATGNEIERRFGADTVLHQTWDENDRLRTQALTVAGDARGPRLVQRRSYSYRPDGYLTNVIDQLAGPRTFDLDPAGRITAVHGRQATERYSYDDAGNITSAGWPAGPESLAAGAQGDRAYQGTLLGRAGNIRYRYDGQGRAVLRRQRLLSGQERVWRYTWDAEDRLVGVVTPDGAQWRYRYDAFGRRIAKQRLDPTGEQVVEQVDFTWDDTVLAEQVHTGTGPSIQATTWDWQPGGVRPVSQTERSAARNAPQEWIDQRFYAIVTDVIGTPTELVDPAGQLAWRAETTLWGAPLSGGPAGTPLRFPGQYFDPETQLHYNYFRHYDPLTGRYASVDPLGMLPAPNPNAYVPNPYQWVDPLGLGNCKLGQAMKGWNNQKYLSNGKWYHLDNAGMKHILQRHHPTYWDGSVKENQSFLHKNETPKSISDKIREVFRQNPQGIPGRMGQIEGVIDGKTYVVGVKGNLVGQFYPKD